jgi:hypothetical protein
MFSDARSHVPQFPYEVVGNSCVERRAYSDEDSHRTMDPGEFEIRTFSELVTTTENSLPELWFHAPIPTFALGCAVALMNS